VVFLSSLPINETLPAQVSFRKSLDIFLGIRRILALRGLWRFSFLLSALLSSEFFD